MKKPLLIAAILALQCLQSFKNELAAQQEVTFSHYSFNTMIVNPAFAGNADVLSVNAINRYRWLSFPGAPRVQTLTIHSPLRNESLAAGISVYNDSKGPTKTTDFQVNLSYRLKLGEGRIGFGLKGGMRFMSNFLNSQVLVIDESDEVFQTDVVSELFPNVGFGIFYNSEKFYLGASVPRFLRSSNSNFSFPGEERHFFFTAGGEFDLNKTGSVKLKPSLLYKMTESTLYQFDITPLISFNDDFWFGPMYRTKSDLGILVGFQASTQCSIGYAFDWSLANKTGVYNNGSHELMLKYDFIYDNKLGIQSPRHF